MVAYECQILFIYLFVLAFYFYLFFSLFFVLLFILLFFIYNYSVFYKKNLINPLSAIYFNQQFHQLFLPTQMKRALLLVIKFVEQL